MAIPTVHLIYVTRYHPWFICRDDHRHIGNICNSIIPISGDGRDLRHSWSACLEPAGRTGQAEKFIVSDVLCKWSETSLRG
jgi:hypothetical protein